VALALEDAGISSPAQPAADVLVCGADASSMVAAIQASEALRRGGLRVALEPKARGVRAGLRYADRAGVPFVALVGEEIGSEVLLRRLGSGDERRLSIEDVVATVRSALRESQP
jgi:histidyl-tRNA synthetase